LDDRGPMLLRNLVPLVPTLHGGVILMLQGTRDGPDAAELRDDFSVGFHNPQLVRKTRTDVNAENVPRPGVQHVMAAQETIGTQLQRLKARAGMTLDDIATESGYRGRSSIQRYFDPGYDPGYLDYRIARNLAKALRGKGNPPISDQDLLALAGVSAAELPALFAPPRELERRGRLPNDIPVFGTALGASLEVDDSDGTARITVEQAELDRGEALDFKRRPPALQGRDAVYGVYVSGSSMFPRFSDGEAALVDPKRPAKIGDDVVVHLRAPDEHDGERVSAVLIKRLSRRNSEFVELEQFNPPLKFRVAAAAVKSIDRIVTVDDLLS
jgi:transcriptional regulator with XRE-family HTH domain